MATPRATPFRNPHALTEDELRKCLEESDEEEDIFGQGSDTEEDYVEQFSEEDSEMSAEDESGSSEDDNERVVGRNVHAIKGKNGHRWSTLVPERRGRVRADNLVTHLPGPKGDGRNVTNIIEAWSLVINDEILEVLTRHTNEEIARKSVDRRNEQSYAKETSFLEIKAFIGLLYISGALRNSNCNVEELWSLDFGNGIFRATMSQQRFKFLASNLRFDDKNDRAERRATDKFAPIRQIWDIYIENCKRYYTPHEYCTIDEQLMSFRGHCPFRIYMASKPDKYGIKIVMLNDSRTFYMVNAIPYIGQVQCENNESVPTYYVRKLSEPIHHTNRNITMDSWFSSIPLANLLADQYHLTMTGTLRKNKREIPPSFLAKKEVGKSLFAFDDNKTLVSFSPKKNKNVLLISTLHHDDTVNQETQKPDMIHAYNSTKGGTDTFDQLCHSYTTARKTNRWPMRVFFGILDGSGINARILLTFAKPEIKQTRRTFLKDLGKELVMPFLRKRLEQITLRRTLRQSIMQILNEPPPPAPHPVDEGDVRRKVRCSFCDRNRDRKTNMFCSICRKSFCMEHRANICKFCENDM